MRADKERVGRGHLTPHQLSLFYSPTTVVTSFPLTPTPSLTCTDHSYTKFLTLVPLTIATGP